MSAGVPGLDERRLLGLMRAAIERCELDLAGCTVLTEAASGAYVVTPLLAAMAGASHVTALTRTTRHGTAEAIREDTMALARRAGVAGRIEVALEKTPLAVGRADVVTNSGHVRPLDARTIGWMRPGAVVALMYESWELRDADLDVAACRARGVRIAGTNERHPAVDVFSFLGILAVRLLLDARVSVYSNRILVLCDNPFGPFVERGLADAGALVDRVATLAEAPAGARYDALVVATTPAGRPALGPADAARIARRWPGAVVGVLWGDVDRALLAEAGVPCWPPQAPAPGHMSMLLSDLGPEPVVRLQAGGLKAAEALWRHAAGVRHPALEYAQPL